MHLLLFDHLADACPSRMVTLDPRSAAANEAMALSVDADSAPDTLRISLQWQGDHDIADFDLQRFGKVLQIQDETEHTGWAIIERRFHARIAHTLPGWALQCTGPPGIPFNSVPRHGEPIDLMQPEESLRRAILDRT